MGDHSDKFIVDCNFDANKIETCIRPKQTTFTSKMDTVDAWKYLIADLATDSKIEYDADSIAMRYMRLNSMSVRQNITYKCRNQHAYLDSNNKQGSYVMVKTADGAEVGTTKNSGKVVLDVIKDECSQLDGKWHSPSSRSAPRTLKLFQSPTSRSDMSPSQRSSRSSWDQSA